MLFCIKRQEIRVNKDGNGAHLSIEVEEGLNQALNRGSRLVEVEKHWGKDIKVRQSQGIIESKLWRGKRGWSNIGTRLKSF